MQSTYDFLHHICDSKSFKVILFPINRAAYSEQKTSVQLMPSLSYRNSSQNTSFSKESQVFFKAFLERDLSKYYVWNSKCPFLEFQMSCIPCLEFQTSIFGIPNIDIMHPYVFEIPIEKKKKQA